ncbi:MAG TPA: hypothetical protein VI168_17900 [Croceibacterium sp.]
MMEGAFLDMVLAALASRDSGAFASARYTENGVELPVGEGLWRTADRLGRYRHVLADPVSGQAAAFATVSEGATRSILALRVALDGGAVREIEVLVARPPLFGGAAGFGDGPAQLDRVGGAAAEWFAEIPHDERAGREELRQVADAYFTGLERNDGLGDYPFADGCIRIENGFRTTEVVPTGGGRETPYLDAFRMLGARQQFETGFFRFVTGIRERRFPVIDEARGLVFAFAFFDHDGTVRDYALADGTPRKGIDRPFSWMIAEAFRIERGLLTRIEALMAEVPYGMRSGWPD